MADEVKKPTYKHQLRWDSSVPNQVQVRGSFDDWKNPLELKKESSGKFGAFIDLESGSRVLYKYVVDGDWRHNPSEPTESDAHGNINNVLQVPEAPSQQPGQESQRPAKTNSGSDPSDQSSSALPLTSSALETNLTSNSLSNTNPGGTLTQEPAAINPSPERPQRSMSSTSRPAQFSPIRSSTSLSSKSPSISASNQARTRRISYNVNSLLNSAPGTPSEKSTPANVSVSNVVSALAGAAATAIPAAIYAATGKDLIRTESESSKRHSDPSPRASTSNVQIEDKATEQSLKLEPSTAQKVLKATGADEASSSRADPVNPAPLENKDPIPQEFPGNQDRLAQLEPLKETAESIKEVKTSPINDGPTQELKASSNEPLKDPGAVEKPVQDATTPAKIIEAETTAVTSPIAPVPTNTTADKDHPAKDTSIFTAPVPHSGTDQAVLAAGPSVVGPVASDLPKVAEGKGEAEKVTPVPVETQNSEIGTALKTQATKASNNSKKSSEGTSSNTASLPNATTTDSNPKVSFPTTTTNVSAVPSSPNVPEHMKRPLGSIRKPSTWRHSIGSIRSSRRSSAEVERKNERKVSTDESRTGSNRGNNGEEDVNVTPKKGIPSLFHKIKTALSPNHNGNKSIGFSSSPKDKKNLSKNKNDSHSNVSSSNN